MTQFTNSTIVAGFPSSLEVWVGSYQKLRNKTSLSCMFPSPREAWVGSYRGRSATSIAPVTCFRPLSRLWEFPTKEEKIWDLTCICFRPLARLEEFPMLRTRTKPCFAQGFRPLSRLGEFPTPVIPAPVVDLPVGFRPLSRYGWGPTIQNQRRVTMTKSFRPLARLGWGPTMNKSAFVCEF